MNLKNGQTMENNKKQTAVDYLIQEIIPSSVLPMKYINEIISKAKAMEKEQIIEFADEYADAVMGGCIKSAEQYYNETYGK